MAEQELRPCPFCGGEKYRMIKPDGVWRVLCLTCKTEGRPSVMNIDAKSAWNKRPLETALEAINAELEKQNRALRHALELRECEETEHKPDPLKDVPYVSLSNAEIAAMTPDHPLYKLVKGKEERNGQ